MSLRQFLADLACLAFWMTVIAYFFMLLGIHTYFAAPVVTPGSISVALLIGAAWFLKPRRIDTRSY